VPIVRGIADEVKRVAVGTRWGRLLTRFRRRIEYAQATTSALGTVANDALALELTVGICRNQRTFLDIGAHIGSVLADVLTLAPGIDVIALEAVPKKATSLARRFPQIVVHQCAAGEHTGDVPFFVVPEASGFSSLTRTSDGVEISVPMRRVDTLVSHADVIKIDVEGAELGVLRGATQLIRNSRPVVMFESSRDAADRAGYPLEEMFLWWTERDYVLLVPNRLAHDGPALDQGAFLEAHFFPRRTTNYFAVPVERRHEVQNRARAVVGVG
jgi:FkbM family methyltransferase